MDQEEAITETTSEETNLKPFTSGEDRAKELGKLGGLVSSKKKSIAARIRELKKKYPFCQKDINDFLLILTSLDKFIESSEAELIELLILKNVALEKADTHLDRYKIQKDYVSTLLEIGLLFYGKEKITVRQEEMEKTKENPIPLDKRFKLIYKYRELGLELPPELKISIWELKRAQSE